MSYRHIIWDWNGTLLDDVELSAACCSREIVRAGLAPLSFEDYRRCFRHPVRDFYLDLGLDLSLHPYEELAASFHDEYNRRCPECRLFPDVIAALSALRRAGMSQSILSALPHDLLMEGVGRFELAGYFNDIRGLDDRLAGSKVGNAQRWLASQDFHSRDVLLIGDTTHDVETAEALGCDCILISRGYQHPQVLARTGHPVFESAEAVVAYLSLNLKKAC